MATPTPPDFLLALPPDRVDAIVERLLLQAIVLSVSSAAEIYGCSRQTMYRMVNDGKIPAQSLEPGGDQKIRLSDLIAYLNAQQQQDADRAARVQQTISRARRRM